MFIILASADLVAWTLVERARSYFVFRTVYLVDSVSVEYKLDLEKLVTVMRKITEEGFLRCTDDIVLYQILIR